MNIEFLKKNRVLAVGGLPGCGKTSLLKWLRAYLSRLYPELTFVIEKEHIDPVFLDMYLDDKDKYSFAFQTNLATVRSCQWKLICSDLRHNPNLVVLMDRTRIDDFAFALDLLKQKKISQPEFEVYLNAVGLNNHVTLQTLHKEYIPKLIYLQVTSKRAMQRVENRGIESEIKFYTKEIMENLIFFHEHTYDKCRSLVTTVDWNEDIDVDDEDVINDKIKQLLDVVAIRSNQ